MGKRSPVSTLAAVGQARRLIDHKRDHPLIRHYPDLGPLQGIAAVLRF